LSVVLLTMASGERSTYEGFFSSYRISIHIIQSKLAITVEHRQTKRVYRTEIDQDAINNITQGVCETCEHLFELLQELIENDGKSANRSLKIIGEETKLTLHVTLVVTFGRTSREFSMKFELGIVQLDDITRLENIINEHAQRLEQLEWNASDRFDHAEKLASIWGNEFQFRNISPSDHSILSVDNHTVRCETYTEYVSYQSAGFPGFGTSTFPAASISRITAKQAVLVTNQGFLSSTNKRYQLVRFNLHSSEATNNGTSFVGVLYQPDDKEWSKIASSDDAWLLNIFNGHIQHSNFDNRPYTWPMKLPLQQSEQQLGSTSHVDVLLDTHHRCLMFRINDQTEDRWAFHLPKHLQINQLYPLIILNNANISVSIDC
jgi:hypothetical protein